MAITDTKQAKDFTAGAPKITLNVTGLVEKESLHLKKGLKIK